MNRKAFLNKSLMVGGLAITAPSALMGQDKKEVFNLEQIRELVFAAHGDFDKTKKIIDANPLILNCANQGRKGDFETSIGAAAHMGRKDIADYLISKGARLDIFCHTFLGYHDFVKKLITDQPHLLRSYGPHGLTLLHHAKVGKHQDMMDWLQKKGLTETFFKGVFG